MQQFKVNKGLPFALLADTFAPKNKTRGPPLAALPLLSPQVHGEGGLRTLTSKFFKACVHALSNLAGNWHASWCDAQT